MKEEFGEHEEENMFAQKSKRWRKFQKMCNSLVQTYENIPQKAETSNLSMPNGDIWKKTNKTKANF